ncbi:non-canonical purine NTP pyrophosphatase [Thermacetogenium phaeum DSM 12270]|jgi:XTP/dITP diphosphohydrolase|uniref:dITP/XTP pyrophosphatase n=1 Tax=Thermacetogenium phaeum (strain ATCC BAA-254 / DSM 26808 / PB) TaxID=1089553 RepID=K4LEZ2_THEPS|nr:XTP/dITP diphosphatase [Thermacetogenium phaeum]AFV10662.1 non-canonical purine NTP pyrophosphatase [Thermacetogenium phaeum DSM 12270]MDN5376695.1 XTP/dITP diphosphohydrolase [Thermacetogenium sp.]
MNKLVIASRNRGKIAEYGEMLRDLPVEILSLADFPDLPEVRETGRTFRENALIKARAAAAATGLIALADDSGLEVDYLNGAPGVYSSRYAGPEQNDEANNRKLLAALEGVPMARRGARFRCVIAIVTPEGREFLSEGVCDGRISLAPRGRAGFGYDPLFLVPSLGKTFAELGPEVKNRISHRAQALRAARDMLRRLI